MLAVFETDFTDVGAVVIGDGELDLINNNQISSFGIPIIVLRVDATKDISLYENRITSIIELLSMSIDDCTSEIESCSRYEASILPPFFRALSDYVGMKIPRFDCPGHQGANSSINILQVVPFTISLENIFRADL